VKFRTDGGDELDPDRSLALEDRARPPIVPVVRGKRSVEYRSCGEAYLTCLRCKAMDGEAAWGRPAMSRIFLVRLWSQKRLLRAIGYLG
jgi:hypothetical protein